MITVKASCLHCLSCHGENSTLTYLWQNVVHATVYTDQLAWGWWDAIEDDNDCWIRLKITVVKGETIKCSIQNGVAYHYGCNLTYFSHSSATTSWFVLWKHQEMCYKRGRSGITPNHSITEEVQCNILTRNCSHRERQYLQCA